MKELKNIKEIPIIFAVTGHRDLKQEDIASLESAVDGVLIPQHSVDIDKCFG